jgi:NADPH2:quinone reductase
MTTTMKQVRFSSYGEPSVLDIIHTPVPTPGEGQVLVKVKASGVNFSDILRRQNRYFMPTPLPYFPGVEAVGEIVALGGGVGVPYRPGMMVLAILPHGGGYAEFVVAPAQYCVPLPEGMDPAVATGIFVQGCTAHLMISQLAGDLLGKTVLVNAAAGGVGSLLVQLAKQAGAKVIATASTDKKLAWAQTYGADVCINYSAAGWGEQLRAATEGVGVDLAFEMVGGEVYNETIRSLRKGGTIIVYGCVSGVQGSIHPEFFVDENISQMGFNLAYFIGTYPSIWQESLGAVIGLVAQGKLRIETAHQFALDEVAEAHRQIESRETTGKVVMVP